VGFRRGGDCGEVVMRQRVRSSAGAHSLAVLLKQRGMTNCQFAHALNENGFWTLRNAAYTSTFVLRMFWQSKLAIVFSRISAVEYGNDGWLLSLEQFHAQKWLKKRG
jgi:hypothetical protein